MWVSVDPTKNGSVVDPVQMVLRLFPTTLGNHAWRPGRGKGDHEEFKVLRHEVAASMFVKGLIIWQIYQM